MTFRVTILGSGSPLPDPNRAGSCQLVEAGGTRLLVDAGRGVVMRLAAAGVTPAMLDAILVTHLHSDHLCALNDVITTHWVMSAEPTPITIFGPERTREVVDGMLLMLAADIEYRLAHHEDLTWEPQIEVCEVVPGDHFELGDVTATVFATDHRPVEPSVAYRIDHAGGSVALAGDSIPCAGLDALCAGADVYVQTVIRDDLVRQIPVPRLQDILDYHSTVADAARTAARASVGTLICTHCVPPVAPGSEKEWQQIAEAHFDGVVVIAEDLTVVDVLNAR